VKMMKKGIMAMEGKIDQLRKEREASKEERD
jgi:hypothetical protein